MVKKGIAAQFEASIPNIKEIIANHMVAELSRFGDSVINFLLPEQAEYGNLTGNTLTSYAYGVYVDGVLQNIGLFKNGQPSIRIKLSKGEVVRDFEDYDGKVRKYFKADVDTDKGYGDEYSYRFLTQYKPKGRFSLVITTGTVYSACLEAVLRLNVLTDSFETVRNEMLESFKPG